MKWWRFGAEGEALSRKVVEAKYGENEWGWDPLKVPRHKELGLWANILRVVEGSLKGGEVQRRGLGFRVGDGYRVHF